LISAHGSNLARIPHERRFAMAAANTLTEARAGMSPPIHGAHAVPVYALGMSLSLFLVISYVLCVLVESFAYGWYIALVFGSLYNFFAAQHR
jgi:hypothetical protein